MNANESVFNVNIATVEEQAKEAAMRSGHNVYVYRWGGVSVDKYGATDTRKYYRNEREICYFTPDGRRWTQHPVKTN